jgi:hypothetical protein
LENANWTELLRANVRRSEGTLRGYRLTLRRP